MRYRIVGAVAALVLAGGTLVVATAGQAGAQVEMTLTATQTNFEYIPAGGQPTTNPSNNLVPSTGDEIIVRESLTEGSTVVGYDNVVCTDTFNDNALCDAVFAISGKGDLHGTALIRGDFGANPPTVFDGSIDGGTFAYAHASGMVHIVNNSADNASTDTFMF
jgi:hypothetical protein